MIGSNQNPVRTVILSAREEVAGQELSESERFEDLTRKLVQVPKSEIDKKRKK